MGLKDRTIEEILRTLDKIATSADELEHWTMAIETTAKNMNNDKSDKRIQLDYSVEEKKIRFFVKDAKSRDNLLKSVELHIPLLPESLQGFFSVFKYNLKDVTF